jgi:hypothetical protein
MDRVDTRVRLGWVGLGRVGVKIFLHSSGSGRTRMFLVHFSAPNLLVTVVYLLYVNQFENIIVQIVGRVESGLECDGSGQEKWTMDNSASSRIYSEFIIVLHDMYSGFGLSYKCLRFSFV